jgi:ribosomal protein L37AE/L43A
MSAGKGDTPRAVNGSLFRRNWDRIFMKKPKQYPDWICDECGRLHGKRPEGNPYGATWHIDECGVCGTGGVEVTEPRDFGHLKEGWDK